jgi:hypothetical protein
MLNMPIISVGYPIPTTFPSRAHCQPGTTNVQNTSVRSLSCAFRLGIDTFLLAYYQWIPFILLLMSVLFYIPSVLWHALATKTGFDIANLVKTLHSMEQLNPDIRDRTLRYIAKHIDRALEIQREMGTGFFSQFKRILRRHCPVFIIGRAQGNYLTFVYLIVKVLYITNVIGQLFLLNVSVRAKCDSIHFLFAVRSLWVPIIMATAWKS